ncbi:MAG TPA: hypothetical protein VEZ70_11165 [Allosphingosinicella sp.]|nr:hypothetical protein [Allosphingosinicella sp.]
MPVKRIAAPPFALPFALPFAWPLALALGLALAGCGAVYENRIESALVDGGLREPTAKCIAGRMVDQLSKPQIHSIARLKEKVDKDLPKMSLLDFLRRHGGELDTHTVSVLTRAGVVCAVTA